MKPISGILRSRVSFGAAIVLLMSLSFAGSAWGMYLKDGTLSAKACVGGTAAGTACFDNTPCLGGGTCQVIAGKYLNPDDGVCVIGVAANGTMKIDSSIKNARDCAAWTKTASGVLPAVDLVGMTSRTACTVADAGGNDGFKHAWSTSLCYDNVNLKGISRVDLDNTSAMCTSKGGSVVGSGKCVAYGWVYMGRKADGSLPAGAVPPTPNTVFEKDGVESTDNLGFCYAWMDMTSATYADRDTCPSEHNNNPPGVAPPGEWNTCGSNLVQGCQTQLSYDAGQYWSLPDPSAVNTSTGVVTSSQQFVCRNTTYATQATCEGANAGSPLVPAPYYWDDTPGVGCIDSAKITSAACTGVGLSWGAWASNNKCLYTYGQKGKLAIPIGRTSAVDQAALPLPVNSATRRALGVSMDLTVHTTQGDCLAAGYQWDNWLPNINRTNATNATPGFAGLPAGAQIVKMDATTLVKDGGGNFHSGTGAVCQKCHSDQSRTYMERNKPGYNETRHKKAADNPGPWQTNFTAENSDWGLKSVQCNICHSTARAAQDDLIQVIPAGVAGTTTQPAAGSPVNASGHQKTEMGGHVTDVCFHCHGDFPSTNPGNVIRADGTDFVLTGKGLAPIGNQFLNSPHAKYSSSGSSDKVDIGNKNLFFSSTFIGYVCRASAGSASLYQTVFKSGVVHKIPFLDSFANLDCTNLGNGTATSGAAGVWEKEGDTISPIPVSGFPTDSKQGNCMTCHDVHWALASTDPEAEPIRRECTTCHSNPGTSASGAPQINLATINHLAGLGTPIEDPSHPNAACESCHMPKSSGSGSYMHLWRISTDPNYVTMGSTAANTLADGSYADAAWVDLDHACGQCHGGGTARGPGYQPVPPALYRTRATLAAVAEGMHASSGQNYAVTFSTSVSGLVANVNATVNCGGLDPMNPDVPDLTCPPGITYDWTWGDGQADLSGTDPDSHLYADPVCVGGANNGVACLSNAECPGLFASCDLKRVITLNVKLNGQQVGAPVTSGVILNPPDLPPVAAASTCAWKPVTGLDTWTWVVTDASTDLPSTPTSVIVDWGDGTKSSVVAGATKEKVYTRVGSFPVKVTALDTKGQSNFVICGTATPAYFTIGGTVRTSTSLAVQGALVTLKKRATTGTWANVGTATTSLTGAYSFPNIKPARYSITVTKTGYAFGPAFEFSAGPNQTVNVNATAPRTGLDAKTEEIDNAN